MNLRTIAPVLALAAPLMLAGCGGLPAAVGAQPVAQTRTAATTTPTMASHTMADGTVMSGASMGSTASAAPATPSATASMVCGSEIQDSIAILLQLPSRPTGTSTFTGGLFTCTYRLAAGTLVLSVQESASKAAAIGYFDGLRSGVGASTPINGLPSLGLPAFQSTSGIVSFVKDNLTLQVDASGLSATVGPARTSRGDFAYTVATDVLACWREH